MLGRLAALFLIAPAAFAQSSGPQTDGPHYMTATFSEASCRMIIATIDTQMASIEAMGEMAMAFGFLLGYETAVGHPLRGEHRTLLSRLRVDCEAEPAATALQLLERYAAESKN
jgi:hypothetical protein